MIILMEKKFDKFQHLFVIKVGKLGIRKFLNLKKADLKKKSSHDR